MNEGMPQRLMESGMQGMETLVLLDEAPQTTGAGHFVCVAAGVSPIKGGVPTFLIGLACWELLPHPSTLTLSTPTPSAASTPA